MQPGGKYELQELERLLSTGERSIRNNRQWEELQHGVSMEVERIKQTFIHEVFSFEDERHLERYIQYHQQALIGIMDRSALFLQDDDKKPRESALFHDIFYQATDELLRFIERHFAKYFDQDAKAPEGYITIAKKHCRAGIRKTQKFFTGRTVDQRLVELLLHVLQKIVHNKPGQGITYRKVMYAKEVQKELSRIMTREKEVRDWNDELRQALYYLNYNSVRVLTYHAHYIATLLDKAETRAEKIEQLSFLLKTINQAQVKPGIRYDQHGASLKTQLSSYVSEEMDYHERLQQLSGNTSSRSPDSFPPGFKLKFEASVSQLAYLVRIFMETKMILNNNLSQVMHFLVNFVMTRRSETVSYTSFRAKFYSVESGTRDAVRSMLTTMIQYIDKS